MSFLDTVARAKTYLRECRFPVAIGEAGSPRELKRRHRVARALAGAALLALAWALTPVAYVGWPLAIIAAWFGVSHAVAAWTGYPHCPKLGAIPSLVLRRHVPTRCGPWERLDQWLDRAAGVRT